MNVLFKPDIRNAQRLLANLRGLDAMDEAETLGYKFSTATANSGIQEGLNSLIAMLEAGEAEGGGEREEEVEEEKQLVYGWDKEYGDEEQNL